MWKGSFLGQLTGVSMTLSGSATKSARKTETATAMTTAALTHENTLAILDGRPFSITTGGGGGDTGEGVADSSSTDSYREQMSSRRVSVQAAC